MTQTEKKDIRKRVRDEIQTLDKPISTPEDLTEPTVQSDANARPIPANIIKRYVRYHVKPN